MRDKSTRTSADPRVIIVDGHGVALTVSRGHVVIRDGDGSTRRERKLSRIDSKTSDGIARIIVLATTGYISFEVMRWADNLGIAIFQVDRDGNTVFCSPGQITADGRLHKFQVLAQPGMPNEAIGFTMMREILTAKLSGQQEVLASMKQPVDMLMKSSARLSDARNMDDLLGTEGRAASDYWKAWKGRVYVPWGLEALKFIPAHWSSFPARSGITTKANGYEATNRGATDFINACLNYAYKICETESMYACHAIGLHPGLGISHSELFAKPGMALDLMEPLRPIADRAVLSFLDYGNGIPLGNNGMPAYLPKECAYETDDGICRLYPPMTHALAAKVSMAVAPHAAKWAQMIAQNLSNTMRMKLTIASDPRISERTEPPGKDVLSPNLKPEDLIPDHIWETVKPLIPARGGQGGPIVDLRALLAGIVAHEMYGASWSSLPTAFNVSWHTCRRRLDQWKVQGAWDAIKAEITKPGVSVAS